MDLVVVVNDVACLILLEDGLFKPKHVRECRLYHEVVKYT